MTVQELIEHGIAKDIKIILAADWFCKYLSGNNMPRIKLIRGKMFPDNYLLPMAAY